MTHSWWGPLSSSRPLYPLSGGTQTPSSLDCACNWPLESQVQIIQLSPWDKDNNSNTTWQHSISAAFKGAYNPILIECDKQCANIHKHLLGFRHLPVLGTFPFALECKSNLKWQMTLGCIQMFRNLISSEGRWALMPCFLQTLKFNYVETFLSPGHGTEMFWQVDIHTDNIAQELFRINRIEQSR